MADLLNALGEPGVAATLGNLLGTSETVFRRSDLAHVFQDAGVEQPQSAIERLLDLRLLQVRRDADALSISREGRRVALLLEALHGGDLDEIYRRLRRLHGFPRRYELVRQGMTTRFLESLMDRPSFGRLYFCSPWINPSDRESAMLRYAVMQLQKRNVTPEVLVITRPPELQPEAIRDRGNGLTPFTDVGAKVHFLKRLHTKLYIREPGANGGNLMALVGSENLTQSNNLELGIQINGDNSLIGQLIEHFMELLSYPS